MIRDNIYGSKLGYWDTWFRADGIRLYMTETVTTIICPDGCHFLEMTA